MAFSRKVSPGWHADPFGAAELRWWDGHSWSDSVATSGVVSTSPPPRAEPVAPSDLPQIPGGMSHLVSPFGGAADPARMSPPTGWYVTQMGSDVQRFWDGHAWTGQYRKLPRRSTLPAWLSVPVILCAPFAVLSLGLLALMSPVAWVLGSLIGAVLAFPLIGAFVWLDRLEPEPWHERIHALLWGAIVATTVGGGFNSLVEFSFGGEAAALFSAPVFEELAKGAGVLVALRRLKIDSVMDGVVYAGWVAAGFALFEDLSYAVITTYESGSLGAGLLVALVRGGPTMFAHPLFTLPIGAAAGWAVTRGRNPYAAAAAGYVPAVILHHVWNRVAALSSAAGVVAWLLLMVLLFFTVVALVTVSRLSGRGTLARHVPYIAAVYGLSAQEAAAFSSWQATLQVRRMIPRASRRSFDAVHAAVSRLAAMREWRVPPSPERQRRAVESLWEARATI